MKTDSKLMESAGWKRVKWTGSSAPKYKNWENWQKKFGRALITIYPGSWSKDGLSYVVSAGANSDLSHSGFLPGIKKYQDAAEEIERRVELKKIETW